MTHVVMVESTPAGFLGRCVTCEALQQEFTPYPDAVAWADTHERYPNQHKSAGRVAPAVLERYYREQSLNPVFTEQQRAQWRLLADEMAERVKPKSETIDGQMSLFGED